MTGFIAVICGLKSEAAAVAASVDTSKIRIGVSGANAQRAEELAREFCTTGAKAIVSVGVSGGLDPALQPGDLVIGKTVYAADGAVFESGGALLAALNATHSCENRNPDNISAANKDPGLRGVGQGRFTLKTLFGADEIIASAAQKRALFEQYAAAAVDMESHGAARAAHQAGVPFLAIRAIADPADRALPKAALNAVAPDGSTRVFKTLGAALREPRQFPALMKLGSDSATALKTLRSDLGLLFNCLFITTLSDEKLA